MWTSAWHPHCSNRPAEVGIAGDSRPPNEVIGGVSFFDAGMQSDLWHQATPAEPDDRQFISGDEFISEGA